MYLSRAKGGSMGNSVLKILFFFVSVFTAIVFMCPFSAWSGVPTMTAEELKAHLGVPGFFIIDVRTASDWNNSEDKVKSALREDPDATREWASKYPKDKAIVLYCA
jgi:hypothetical protein